MMLLMMVPVVVALSLVSMLMTPLPPAPEKLLFWIAMLVVVAS